MKKDTAVDFNNPESIAEELTAADVNPSTEPKAKKPRKPRVVKVTFVADKDYATGETISFDYELPMSVSTRGAVAGIALEEMTDDQLKIEYRNANSVAYKTKKAGHDATKAETRLNACKAEMEKRGIQPTARGNAVAVDAKSIANMIAQGKISVEDIQKFLDAANTTAPTTDTAG